MVKVRITSWMEREPDVFIARRGQDRERRQGERRTAERRRADAVSLAASTGSRRD